MAGLEQIALLVEFAPGTKLAREPDRASRLPIVRNGPPGTFVVFPNGTRLPLPSDQIVYSDDLRGRAVVGFGGMGGPCEEDGRLVFARLRDLDPPESLSPERGVRMTIEPGMLSSVSVLGRVVWASH